MRRRRTRGFANDLAVDTFDNAQTRSDLLLIDSDGRTHMRSGS